VVRGGGVGGFSVVSYRKKRIKVFKACPEKRATSSKNDQLK